MLNVQFPSRRAYAQIVIFALLLLNSTLAFAQSQVSGLVTDKSGEPLIGVNVLEKGTTNGVITDFNGQFALNVAQGKTLVFSYVGYITQEVKVAGNTLKVIMEDDAKTLDEVVVVGYGSMTRKDVTSSITTVKADKLNVGTYTDPAQLLQGKVPGLTIVQSSDPNGGTASITLRGASSLREGAAMEPYYVIDGIPGMSLAMVAPEDIESIDVLRDATATAIYGSKAANGVIIVTTKKGKTGKATVTYSGYVAMDNVLKNLDMMSAGELRAYAKANNFTIDNDMGADTNWQKEVQRTAVSHNHNVSISGGNDDTSYNASINYMERQGVIRGTEMDRLIGRAFVQTKALNDRLTLSFNVNGSITNNHSVESGKDARDGVSVYDAMNYYSPLMPVRNDDGSWTEYQGVSQNYNPLSIIYEDRHDHEIKRLQGTAKASLNIVDGLVWNATLSYQNEQFLWSDYNSKKSQIVKKNGKAHRHTTSDNKKVFETYLNYDKTFNEVHKLGLMAGYSWEEGNTADGYGLSVYDFYNDILGYNNMGLGNKMDISDIWSSAESTLRMISFYGRVNYSFNSKYMLQATVRRDGSSAFGKNNRWATFPSASVAWRLSEESFIKNLNAFDDLKLRVGYGVSGNSLGFDAYTAQPIYDASGWFSYTAPNGITSDYRTLAAKRNANPDLKWEQTSMLNVGIDFTVLGGRFSGTVEYYNKKTSDLIYDYPVSTNRYQYGSMTANVGDISNKGIELTLNAIPVQTKNFQWSTTLNLSHNKNKVEKLSNDTYSVEYVDLANPNVGGFVGANTQRLMEGEPIGTFYMWEWAGYNDAGVSVFNDYDEEGNLVGTTDSPKNEDRRKVGSAQPKLNLGWSNTLTYKNWSLTAFFQGVFGNKILNSTRAQFNNVTNLKVGKNGLREIINGQKATDTNAQAPSDRYLENGSYLRLSSLSLGYNFGKLGNWINSLKVTATCNNLFTITGYEGRDPEINLGGLTPGIDSRESYYPRTRTFMLGLNVNF